MRLELPDRFRFMCFAKIICYIFYINLLGGKPSGIQVEYMINNYLLFCFGQILNNRSSIITRSSISYSIIEYTFGDFIDRYSSLLA
jgi:hypothetical protein